MRNFIRSGDVVTMTAPTCSLSICDGIVVGNPFGIYVTQANLTDELSLTGLLDK